jgi:hypothetical protein
MNSTSRALDPVNSRKVTGRRILQFDSIDEMMADVDRLVEAQRVGRLQQLGNWTLGQILGHLAVWAEYSYTGLPLRVPLVIRWILRLQKHSFLYRPQRPGMRIPFVAGGTLATEPMSLDDALPLLRRVMERLKSDPPTAPCKILGHLRHEEWIAINLRHAELHLGFLNPQ